MITSLEDANIEIMNSYASEVGSLDPALAQSLCALLATPAPTERLCRFIEVVYARRDEVSEATLASAADVCAFATTMGFNDLGEDQRGFRIAAILRGETIEGEAPAPVAAYCAPEPEEPEPEA